MYFERPTQKGWFLVFYTVMMSCRKAPPEFRFASSTLRNFVPSGAAHEAAAGHALSEPSDNSIIYPDGKPSECTESLIEAVDKNKDRFVYEAADLLYHYLVLMEQMGVGIADIEE